MKCRLIKCISLAIALISVIMSMTACFDPDELVSNGEKVTYYSVVGLTELGKEVEEFAIPNMYQGLPVVRIAPYAFKDSKILKTVHLGNNTAVIDEYAFASSTVTSVYIPDGKCPSDIRVPTYTALAVEGGSPLLTFYVSADKIDLFRSDLGFWEYYKEYLAVKPE